MFALNFTENIIATKNTNSLHFAKCNNANCSSLFLVDPAENPGELGFLCPACSAKLSTCHTVQCATCGTVLNFIRTSPLEEKVVFSVDKCSHCFGTVEDEWEIEPLYQSDSYI